MFQNNLRVDDTVKDKFVFQNTNTDFKNPLSSMVGVLSSAATLVVIMPSSGGSGDGLLLGGDLALSENPDVQLALHSSACPLLSGHRRKVVVAAFAFLVVGIVVVVVAL